MTIDVAHSRYARLEALADIGAAGMAQLRSGSVAVLGVGNIGNQVARHLVLLGLDLVLVDRDLVSDTNLGTQGYAEGQVGRPKAHASAEWLGPLNPACRIEPVHADIRQLGLGALREADLLVSCLDNRSSRIIVNELAVRLGIPWVDGALDGSGRTLFGRVACYDPRQSGSACYLCPHDAASLRIIATESGRAAGCSATWWTASDDTPPPTLATSALGGAVASVLAIWALKVLLGQAEGISGREVYFDLGRYILSTHRLRRNPRCLMDHQVWQLTSLSTESPRATVAHTFAAARTALGDEVALHFLRRPIVSRICCARCGAEKRPYRALDTMNDAALLCACGYEMHVAAAGLLDRAREPEAEPFLDRTWAEMGFPAADVVVATTGTKDLHILLSDTSG